MIDVHLITNHAGLQWSIPSLRSVPTILCVPQSVFFECRGWTDTQCQYAGVSKTKRTESKTKKPMLLQKAQRTEKPRAPLAAHKRNRAPLFYPLYDRPCTVDEHTLTQGNAPSTEPDAIHEKETLAEYDDDDDDALTTKEPSVLSPMGTTRDLAMDSQMCIIKPVTRNEPMVSVVMTTYNCVKYIEFAIRSIQLQTYTDWELIVIDDHSTDDTSRVLRTLAWHDDRIVYLQNPHNIGCYASKNIGVQHARGRWLTFQDADDYSMSERLEKQLTFCLYGGENTAPAPTPQAAQCVHQCCYVKSLARREKVWSWVPITMFVSANVFRERLGAFDTVRFGADSEIKERMDVLGIRVGLFDDYLYACPDRWVELSSRAQSLTGNTSHTPIRAKYKRAYTEHHNRFRHTPSIAQKQQAMKYSFGALSRRPFPVVGLDKKERVLMYPSPVALERTLADYCTRPTSP